MSDASLAAGANQHGSALENNPSGARWRMVALAFLAQNTAIGMSFGAYGTLVDALEREFSTSRALAASGLSVMTLTMSLLSPLVGWLMRRWSLRTIMIAGALLAAAGYAVLAFVTNIYLLLSTYALLIGPGVCLLGVIPSSALVANWFGERRGRALGFVNMPFFVFVFPFISAAVLASFSLRGVFLLLAAVLLALAPCLLLVVDHPGDEGSAAHADTQAVQLKAGVVPLSSWQLLRTPAFLALTLGVGFLMAAGMTMVTHVVALALDRGLDLASASLLLAIFGVSGAVGALAFGWLADRIGPGLALATSAFVQLPGWLILFLGTSDLPALTGIAAVIGLCCGATTGLMGTAIGAWFDLASFGQVMGLIYAFLVPFLFGAAPFAGYLFDVTGDYRAALALHALTLVGVGLMFLVFRPGLPARHT